MKPNKIRDTKDIIKRFDENAEILESFGTRTEEFTPLIKILELLMKQMKITREVSKNSQEQSDLGRKEFAEKASKRLMPKMKRNQNAMMNLQDPEFRRMLFSLPDRRCRKYLEIMLAIEDAEKHSLIDPAKNEKIDKIINSLERYIEEIKELNKPSIPAKIDLNQTIVLKVMFKHRKGIWRKIEMRETDTMQALHEEIQDVMEWDNDHMYSFFMDNKRYSKDPDMEVTCPFEPDGRKTSDKTPIGIFGLKKGQKFVYLFDFGDDHEFEIEVEDFGTVEKGRRYPILIGSKGKAPEQYPDYEDEKE